MLANALTSWVLQKMRAAINRPLTYLEILRSPVEVERSPSYREREVILQFGWILSDQCRIVYDVGASVGTYAHALGKVKSVEKVVAFEPLKDVFLELKASTGSNPKITCINAALGNFDGEENMYRNAFSQSSSILKMEELHVELFPQTRDVSNETVVVARMDSLVERLRLPLPDLIKIDVQGFELSVLQGALQTLKTTRYVVTEVNLLKLYENMATFEEIAALLGQIGFEFRGMIDVLRTPGSHSPVSLDAVFINRALPPQLVPGGTE